MPDSILPTDCLLVGVDWPLSLGVSLYLRIVIATPEKQGCFTKLDDKNWLVCITENLDMRRTFELVVHECSHAVDAYFEQTHVIPCTELRAYTLDWIVGHAYTAINNR